jgi:hypothetical protein
MLIPRILKGYAGFGQAESSATRPAREEIFIEGLPLGLLATLLGVRESLCGGFRRCAIDAMA